MTFEKTNPRLPIGGDKAISISTWSGEVKRLQRASLNAEKDQDGEIFYKISGSYRDGYGHAAEETFMISYHYDKQEAMSRYIAIVESLLEVQEINEKQP